MKRPGALWVRVLAALVLTVASFPLAYGFTVQGERPAFTLNICHPPQVAGQAGDRVLVPALSWSTARPLVYLCGVVQRPRRELPTRVAFAPDPPPPKAFV